MITFLNPLIEVRYLSDKVNKLKPATDGSAAYDLQFNCEHEFNLYPGETHKAGTGISINIADKRYAALILPRSGLGSEGIVLANLIGLCDSDYQGELIVNMWNRTNSKPIKVQPYERIAQLIIIPVIHPIWEEVTEFSFNTERGGNGFGSTGV